VPTGKKNHKSMRTRNESPNCVAAQFGDSSFLLQWQRIH